MIFKKIIITIFISFWLNVLLSQNVFNIQIPNNVTDFVLNKDSGYVFFSTENGLYSVGGTIYNLNKYGEIDSLYLPKLKTEVNYSILNSKDGYIITGETHDEIIADGIGNKDLIVEKIDFLGNIIWQLPLKGTHFHNAINTTDGNFLILGTINEQPNSAIPDIVIYKVNEDGTLIWEKIIGEKFVGIYDKSYSEQPNFIQEINNNYYLSYGNYKNLTLDASLTKITSNGDVLWSLRDNYNTNKLQSITAVFKLNGKIFFVNSDNFEVFEINDVNGNYTKTNNKIYALNSKNYGLNYEISCNQLTIIEQKVFHKYSSINQPTYSFPVNTSYVYNIKKALDGGYVFLSQYNKFTKTDCKGNIDFWDLECTNRLKPNNNLMIYPNPTTKYINIETDFKITKVIIIDPLGKELVLNNYCNCNKQKIDVSKYSQGTYFLKVVGIYSSEIVKFIKY